MSRKQAQTHLNKKIDFEKLSKAQQRTMIATDVLAQLELERIKATNGIYVEMNFSKNKISSLSALEKTSMQSLLGTADSCRACALGSCFLALATRTSGKRGLNLKGTRYDFNDPASNEVEVVESYGSMWSRLQKYFSKNQLRQIESAFEVHEMGELDADGNTIDREALESAVAFGQKYRGAQNRLNAIMTNIVENCGEFKP